jgi:hypothetical protein
MFSGIQGDRGTLPKNLIDIFWNIYQNCGISDMDDIFTVFDIVLKNHAIRTTHMVGWKQECFMPYFSGKEKSCFQYEEEFMYEEECFFSSMLEQLNGPDIELEWKMKLTNYFTWLGYKK